MNKLIFTFISTILLSPLVIGAVTWTLDSEAFSFPTVTATKNTQSLQANTFLRWRYIYGESSIQFHYQLPPVSDDATLKIYTITGVLIKKINLVAGSSSLSLNLAENKLGTGIYLVSMRCANIENKIKFSIVK